LTKRQSKSAMVTPLAPARSGCGQRALSASNSSPDVKTQSPGHPSRSFNLLKGNRRWLFQEAAFPRHLFRGPPDKPARRTPAVRSPRKVFCSVFSPLKLSGVARRLSLAAGKNSAPRARTTPAEAFNLLKWHPQPSAFPWRRVFRAAGKACPAGAKPTGRPPISTITALGRR